MQPLHKAEYTDKRDFKLDRKVTIEVGGESKTRKQIADVENAYVAADSIDIGYCGKIPLWMFGILY